jgi:hypothetical protein
MDKDPSTGRAMNARDRYNRITEALGNNICKRGGGIVLFHDIYPITATYLKTWIQELRKSGHRLVSLKELHPECFDERKFEDLKKEPKYFPDGYLKQCWNPSDFHY